MLFRYSCVFFSSSKINFSNIGLELLKFIFPDLKYEEHLLETEKFFLSFLLKAVAVIFDEPKSIYISKFFVWY